MLKKKKISISLIVITTILLGGMQAHAGAEKINKSSSRKYRSMARVYMAWGQYQKAQPLAEQALEQAKKDVVGDRELSACLIDLAYIYNKQNKYDQAEKVCRQGLELQKQAYYERHPYVAYTMRTLADIYCGKGDSAAARQLLNDAVAIMLEVHSDDQQVMAPFNVDIAKVCIAQGRLDEAEQYFEKALELIYGSYGLEHLYAAEVVGEIAKLYILQGRFDEAEPLVDFTLKRQEKTYGKGHHLLAPALLTKAKILEAKGDYKKHKKLTREAFSSVEKTGNLYALADLQQQIDSQNAALIVNAVN